MNENNDFSFDIEITINVSVETIDDIMCAALEGGITYWCGAANVVGEYLGEDASEQIARGGTLELVDIEDDSEVFELTRDKFLAGLKQFIIDDNRFDLIEGGEIDTGMLDSADADCIVQYALFGEIVYG